MVLEPHLSASWFSNGASGLPRTSPALWFSIQIHITWVNWAAPAAATPHGVVLDACVVDGVETVAADVFGPDPVADSAGRVLGRPPLLHPTALTTATAATSAVHRQTGIGPANH